MGIPSFAGRALAHRAASIVLAAGVILGAALLGQSTVRRPAKPWQPAEEPWVFGKVAAAATPECPTGIKRIEILPVTISETSPGWTCSGQSVHVGETHVTYCDAAKPPDPEPSRFGGKCALRTVAGDFTTEVDWTLNVPTGCVNCCNNTCGAADPPSGPITLCESACDAPPPPCCDGDDIAQPINIPSGEMKRTLGVFPLGEGAFPSRFELFWRGKATARLSNLSAEPLGRRLVHSFSYFLWKGSGQFDGQLRHQALVTVDGSYVEPFFWNDTAGQWEAAEGRHSTLEAAPPGAFGVEAVLRRDDGRVYRFHDYVDGLDPREGMPIRMDTPAGEWLEFDVSVSGLLLAVRNRQGARVSFSYFGAAFINAEPVLRWGYLQAVVSPDGHRFELEMDRGLLKTVRGPDGPLWSLEYAPAATLTEGPGAGLSELRDAQGRIDAQWSYVNDDGLTVATETGPEGVGDNLLSLSFEAPSTVVVAFTPAGASAPVENRYTYGENPGALPHVMAREVAGSCPNCGSAGSERTYWPGTNDVRAVRDAQGVITAYLDGAADPSGACLSDACHAQAYEAGHVLVMYEACQGTLAAPDCSVGRRTEYAYLPGTGTVRSSSRPSVVAGATVTDERIFDGASTRVSLDRREGRTAATLDGVPSVTSRRATRYTYGDGDGDGLDPVDLLRIEGPYEDNASGPGPSDPRTDFEYYAATDPDLCDGLVVAENARRLRRSIRFVNGSGRKLETQWCSYDGLGRPQKTVNPDGTVTELSYDFRGNVTRTVVDAEGLHLVTDSVYNANGDLVALLLPRSTSNGRTGFSYQYDDGDRLVAISQGFFPAGGGPLVPLQSMAYFFDSWGNKTGSEYRDSTGATVTSEGSVYDQFNRLASLARPGGDSSRRTSFGYDVEGNLTGVTDAQGDRVLYGSIEDPSRYDRFGKLSLVQQEICDRPATDPDAPCFPHMADVRYQYDAALNLKEVAVQDTVRGGAIRTSYVTDDFGQTLKVLSPDSGVSTYRYDGAGRLLETRDARGKVFRFEYDRLGRITRKVNASPVMVTTGDPGNGTANVNEDGTVTYRPDENYSGPDSFTYTVNGRNGDTSAGTVTLTVNPVNDPPVAHFKMTAGVVGTSVQFVILAEDVDDCELSFSVVSEPTLGTVDSFAPLACTPGVIANHDEVRVTYTGAQSGFDEIVFSVSDGEYSSQATVALVVTKSGAALLGVSTEAHSALGLDDSESLDDGACTTAPCALESYSESIGPNSGSFGFARASRGSLAAKSGGTAQTGSTPADASFAARGSGFFTLPDLRFTSSDPLATQVCTNGMNLTLNGTIAAALSGVGGTITAGVGIRVNIGGTKEFTGNLVTDGVTVSGTGLLEGVVLTENLFLTTPGFCVPVNEPVPLTVELATAVDADLFGADLSADSLSDYSNTFSFPDAGPVFELPPGSSAESESGGIADNVWTAPIQSVAIDVKPGNPDNAVPCGNPNALIPLALLTTPDFDALSVDADTARFEDGAELHRDGTGRARRHIEDADGDGVLDLMFHVRLSDTTLSCDSRVGSLTGATTSGTFFTGSDLLTMKLGGGL